jgi:hypothetical protein
MSTTLRQLRRAVSRLADRLRISSKIKAGAAAAKTACQNEGSSLGLTTTTGSFPFLSRDVVLLQHAGYLATILDT